MTKLTLRPDEVRETVEKMNDFTYDIEASTEDGGEYFPLKWTTDKPTESGLYRVKNVREEIFWLEVFDKDGVMCYQSEVDPDNYLPLPEVWYTHFLGPLPIPEPPTE